MIFVTSLSPNDNERQRQAIASWDKYGLLIVSFNEGQEIPALKKLYHDVIFFEVQRTAYDAYKKHYVYAYDLITAAFTTTESDTIFVINSDIVLEGLDTEKLKKLESLSHNSLVGLKRFDKDGANLECWEDGFDGFILHRKFLPIIKDAGFVIGQTFWDWWLPMLFIANDLNVWTYDDKFLIHQVHGRNHNQEQWDYNLQLFKNYFNPLFKTDISSRMYFALIDNNSKNCNHFPEAQPYEMKQMKTIGTHYGCHTIPEGVLKKDSIVYSFGLGEDASFDAGLVEAYGCHVNLFDPTPRSKYFYENQLANNPNFTFNPIGIAGRNYNAKFFAPKDPTHVSHSIPNLQGTEDFFTAYCARLKSIMVTEGHSHIDLLKMDIEGAEYEVLQDMIECKIKPAIICVEFHKEDNSDVINSLVEYGYSVAFFSVNQYTFIC